MKIDHKLLFTPGPLTTSVAVKQSMMKDIGTRDSEFNTLVQSIREQLSALGNIDSETHSVLLLPGSGTYGVESVLTSVVRPKEKVLILENGAYGKRMAEICTKAGIPFEAAGFSTISALPLTQLEDYIAKEDITHVAFVHCETTAGVLNDLAGIMKLIRQYKKIAIVDAMSSFGGLPINIGELDIDYLITSSNKCLHGVPGIAIIFAKRAQLETCQNVCHSLSLDLYEQYMFMESHKGGFRFTSPTHVLLALHTALQELLESGGISKRHEHYQQLQARIQNGMKKLGFETLVEDDQQSAIITTYLLPEHFDFDDFYTYMKENGFLLYSGKLPDYPAFRIGNIGNLSRKDVERMLASVAAYRKGERL